MCKIDHLQESNIKYSIKRTRLPSTTITEEPEMLLFKSDTKTKKADFYTTCFKLVRRVFTIKKVSFYTRRKILLKRESTTKHKQYKADGNIFVSRRCSHLMDACQQGSLSQQDLCPGGSPSEAAAPETRAPAGRGMQQHCWQPEASSLTALRLFSEEQKRAPPKRLFRNVSKRQFLG